MAPGEFCDCYRVPLEAVGVVEGGVQEQVQQTRTTFGLAKRDVVIGQHKLPQLKGALP